MGARLRIFLTREQDQTLLNLKKADVPQKVKDRAEVIRLNAHGWYVEKIAAHVNWTSQTVREVLHRWEKQGLEGLWELPGRGGKAKWNEKGLCCKNFLRTEQSLQSARVIQQLRKFETRTLLDLKCLVFLLLEFVRARIMFIASYPLKVRKSRVE